MIDLRILAERLENCSDNFRYNSWAGPPNPWWLGFKLDTQSHDIHSYAIVNNEPTKQLYEAGGWVFEQMRSRMVELLTELTENGNQSSELDFLTDKLNLTPVTDLTSFYLLETFCEWREQFYLQPMAS